MQINDIVHRIKPLSRLRRACMFYKVDLHVHSPDSTDYSGNKNISAREFVESFAERGFDLIAITDHNTGTYIDNAIQASAEIASEGRRKIKILPGAELYVSPGIHLLAILPEGGSASISDLLSHLGLGVGNHGDTTKLISRSIGDVAMSVRERGGMLIGAHCDSKHGIVHELEGQARLEWLQTVDALEIKSTSADERVEKTISYVTTNLNVAIPFTYGSDSHDASTDSTGMWVKMADPSFGSLFQLTFEPDLRVSRTEPSPVTHCRILGFTTTQGIYANERFRFSPHLNVILGGRGAGKSAAIDLLRFAFESEPRPEGEISKVFADRIKGFLQSVGDVVVTVVGTDGNNYVIVRSGTYEIQRLGGTPVFTEPACVYQVVGEQLIAKDLGPQDVMGIEFYGQGEAAWLATRVDEQLRLIDDNLDVSEIEDAIAQAEQQLTTDEGRLIECKAKLVELVADAATRPHLETNHEHLGQSLADPIFEERAKKDKEKDWILGQQQWIDLALEGLPTELPARTQFDIDIEQSTERDALETMRHKSDHIFGSAQAGLANLRGELSKAKIELEEEKTPWDLAFETAQVNYRDRLSELGATDLAAVAEEHRRIAQELTRIGTIVDPEIVSVSDEIAALTSSRVKLLEGLNAARALLASARSEFVDHLNSTLSDSVNVDLTQDDKSLFFDAVESPLQGSGMVHREDQIMLACAIFTPGEFIEIIRTKSLEQLKEIGITEHSASLMTTILSDEFLYQIERVDVPKLPKIRVKREGEDSLTDLSSLSVGEKCSAILSIALLSKGKPLVIDQPEDDLDHAFIIDSIVEGVRAAKADRQIIATTHNPNIPVLGDAEMVFRVARKTGVDNCYIHNSGGLEIPVVTTEVQNLEGGAEAFERRRQKYSRVPSSHL